MKTICYATILILSMTFSTFLHGQNAEANELLKLNSDFDKASVSGDLAFFERRLAPDFISYHPDGSFSTRAEVLARIKKEKDQPTYQLTSLDSENVKVKVSGNFAFITGLWKATASLSGTPHKDSGYYTAIFEKRNGDWQVISEHVTEKVHTAAELEPSLRQASEDFDRAIRTKDAKLYGELLSEEFVSITNDGKVNSKSEEIAQISSPDLIITSVKADDKKFRIHRSTAVETGRYNVTGSYKGKAFNETGRYTSTWFYTQGKWMIVSDHNSTIK